jgi:hypothetical protein
MKGKSKMIHEHTNDMYSFEECKKELLRGGLITNKTSKSEIDDIINDVGFNTCNRCDKYTGTLELLWDCDYRLEDGCVAVCVSCSKGSEISYAELERESEVE